VTGPESRRDERTVLAPDKPWHTFVLADEYWHYLWDPT
jgi:hypothetical protein